MRLHEQMFELLDHLHKSNLSSLLGLLLVAETLCCKTVLNKETFDPVEHVSVVLQCI